MSDTFLTQEEIRELTGRTHKTLQVAALSKMAIPFFVNATGRAVVARAAIIGRGTVTAPQKKQWIPKVLKTG